jgi:hypothetical protein
MCTCNGASFLQQQLQSIAAQTLPPDELVICDDCSTDDTAQIVHDFVSTAPFSVHFHCNSVQLGVTRNFQQAIACCDDGDRMICLADQDDVWMPQKLDRLHSVLQDQRIGVVFCNGQVVDESLHPLPYGLWDALWFGPAEQAKVRTGRALDVFLKHTVAAGGTLAFRASYRPVLLPMPDLRSAHDAWTAMLIAAVAEVAILDERLIQYRLHGNNHIGVQRVGLVQQIGKARLQVRHHAFRYAEELHQAAVDRLQMWESQGHELRPGALQKLREKIRHARARDRMNGHGLSSRLPSILRESLSLRYSRYSYGWKSIAQDLFLR